MQQLTIEDTPASASDVRVTPEELTQAIAAIEMQRDSLAEHEAATIGLGEAVQQLHLDATPEELLAEIEMKRQNTQQNKPAKQATRSELAIGFAFLMSPLLVVCLLAVLALQTARTRKADTSSLQDTPVPFVPTRPRNLISSLNPELFQTVKLQEGQTVRCSYSDLQALARTTHRTHLQILRNPACQNWTLLQRYGRLCVQCWTTPTDAAELVYGRSGTVSSVKSYYTVTKIVLPVEKFLNPKARYDADDGTPFSVTVN